MTDWQTAYAPWDHHNVTLNGLSPSTEYEFQIRAVDRAWPVNYGAWSESTTFLSATDTTPPDTPAAPSVAASLIAVQVTHTLGLASGGTYNLPLDMDHFRVHVGTSSGFTPSPANLVGKLLANGAMVAAGIPAVGFYPVDTLVAAGAVAYVKVVAVDKTGNMSAASAAASATAALIDEGHFGTLNVSKLTAGTMSAAVILGGSIKTATSGARTEQDSNGIRLYNSGGTLTVDLNTGTGTGTFTGVIQTGTSGQRIVVDASGTYPTIWLKDSGGANAAFINSPGSGLGLNTGGNGAYYGRLYLTDTVSELASKAYGTQTTLGGIVSVASTGAFVSHILASSVTKSRFTADSSGAAIEAWTSGVLRSSATLDVGATVKGFDGSATEMGRLTVDGAGAVRLESKGGSNYAVLGAPNNNYVLINGDDVTAVAQDKAWWYGVAYATVQAGAGAIIDLYDTASTVNIRANTVDIGNGHSDGTDTIKSNSIYYRTSTFTANVGIATSPLGVFYRLTSSARYKVDVAQVTLDPSGLYDLAPVTYYDREQATTAGGVEGLSQQVGLLAEQVAAIPGWGRLLTELDEDGDPESVNYERVGVAALVWLRDLERRVRALEKAPALPPRKAIQKKILDLSSSPRKVRPQPSRPVARPKREEPR